MSQWTCGSKGLWEWRKNEAGNARRNCSCVVREIVVSNKKSNRESDVPPLSARPRSRSRDSGDENDNIQERHFRPHFLQAPGDLIVQEGRLCRMDCKVYWCTGERG